MKKLPAAAVAAGQLHSWSPLPIYSRILHLLTMRYNRCSSSSSSSSTKAMLSSPQAEFEPDRFREFALTIKGKLAIFSRTEDVPWLDESIRLTAFHLLWRDDHGKEDNVSLKSAGEEEGKEEFGSSSLDGRRVRSKMPFPYPCIAVLQFPPRLRRRIF